MGPSKASKKPKLKNVDKQSSNANKFRRKNKKNVDVVEKKKKAPKKIKTVEKEQKMKKSKVKKKALSPTPIQTSIENVNDDKHVSDEDVVQNKEEEDVMD